jgi:hypothetical protein
VQLPEGYVQAVGIEQLTLIQAAAPIVYSDLDGDGYEETFTIGPIATAITDARQIALYFAAADRFDGSALGERWRVQPITVTLSGGTVTITGARWLLVKPIRYEGVSIAQLNPATAANFVTTADVYQRATNAAGTTTDTSQATLIWETDPGAGCCGADVSGSAYSGSPFDPAATARAVGRVGIRDELHGIVTPAESTYNAATGTWSSLNWSICAEPDSVIVRYLAGYPLDDDGQFARRWQTIVARLAAAELARPICACEGANKELYSWQFDLSRAAGVNDEQYATSQEILNCPFGTRRGHVYAWKQVQNLRQTRGFLPG